MSRHKMQKRNLRTERKKHRLKENKSFILDEAEKIFAKKGYTLATMDEIAEKSQFSKATLYSYFKSKNDIFIAVIYNCFDQVYKELEKIKEKEKRASEKLKEYIYCVYSFHEQKKNIIKIFFIEIPEMKQIFKIEGKSLFSPASKNRVPEIFKKHIAGMKKITTEIIQEGVENGEFRKINVRDASHIFGSMIRGFSFGLMVREKKYSIEKSTDLLHSFFLNGIKKESNNA
jgi:AcrR family transcriptional regulator